MHDSADYATPIYWQSLSLPTLPDALEDYLQSRIPGSHLRQSALPLVPEVSLYLINDDYPRDGLNTEQVEALMDNPPYWGFCWGSGQGLSRWILDNPDNVKGKTLVDFGCGSGVVGIAAKLAGAKRVILCDQDEIALAVSRVNAAANGVDVEFSNALENISLPPQQSSGTHNSLVTVADVFYDRDNLPLLPRLLQTFDEVLVADSRLKGQALAGMEIFSSITSHTVPDLDESLEFSQITLYRCVQNNKRYQ